MRSLRLGFSSCPNDTFIFAALAAGRIALPDLHRPPLIADVEPLNRLVVAEALDISKVSLAAYGQLRENYVLLPCGAALGHGQGPLLVSRAPLAAAELQRVRVAVPGLLTTAALLLRIHGLRAEQLVVMPFDRIPAAVKEGRTEAGIVIHESRFACSRYGLLPQLDLGAWWLERTGLPLPLGGIVARRALGRKTLGHIAAAIRASLEQALSAPETVLPYVRQHAREQNAEAIDRHIRLFVNRDTLGLDAMGQAAILTLLEQAGEIGELPDCCQPVFLD